MLLHQTCMMSKQKGYQITLSIRSIGLITQIQLETSNDLSGDKLFIACGTLSIDQSQLQQNLLTVK